MNEVPIGTSTQWAKTLWEKSSTGASTSGLELEEEAVPNLDTSAKLSVGTSRKVNYSPADMQFVRLVMAMAHHSATHTSSASQAINYQSAD